MAKKKLFGNQKEPRCETCAHGKLSANGESVLCVQGGAVPLTHSCRRYQYDPLRRVPKRRPLPADYNAADFALDDQPATAVAPVEAATEPAPDRSTFDHLFAYLNEHETPDADTIRAILSKTYDPQEETETEEPLSDDEILNRIVEEASQAAAALAPDDSVDIDGDLQRLDMTTVPDFARAPLTESADNASPLFLPEEKGEDVGFLTDASDETDAPLSANDLLFLPKGTPSDHDTVDNIGGGFTPLTGD